MVLVVVAIGEKGQSCQLRLAMEEQGYGMRFDGKRGRQCHSSIHCVDSQGPRVLSLLRATSSSGIFYAKVTLFILYI